MALILFARTTSPEVTAPPQRQGFQWDRWYAQNKARLSKKRAKRYREDPSYRAAALQRSRQQRTRKPEVEILDGSIISFNDMATRLGITVWVLREWRRKNYFPEPVHRDGRLWFKSEHEPLLGQLLQFFQTHGVRVGPSKKVALDNVISLIYSNWP